MAGKLLDILDREMLTLSPLNESGGGDSPIKHKGRGQECLLQMLLS